MNWKTIQTIVLKDIKQARQNRAVWRPLLVVPLIFVIVLPLMLISVSSGFMGSQQSLTNDPDLALFMERMPEFMVNLVSGLNEMQAGIVLVLGYLFAPLFLILPLMYSTVIAAESFAGERERKTIEALLYTPATDGELFIGKVLAAFIPAVMITLLCFLGYIIVLNTAAFSIMGKIWFPLPGWYPLILWVSPAISLLGIAATVIISAKTQTFMGAYQTSASLVIVVLALLAGQATGVVYLNVLVALAVGAVIFAIDAVLFYFAIRGFNREKLLVSAN